MAKEVPARTFCSHIMVLEENGRDAVCILCGFEEKLNSKQLNILQSAERAGAIIVRMSEQDRKDRQTAIDRIKKTRKRKKRRTKKGRAQRRLDAAPEGFVTANDAADLTGGRADARRVRKLARDGKIESIKIGGRVLLKATDVMQMYGTGGGE